LFIPFFSFPVKACSRVSPLPQVLRKRAENKAASAPGGFSREGGAAVDGTGSAGVRG